MPISPSPSLSQEHEANLVPHSVCSLLHIPHFFHKFDCNSKRSVEYGSDYFLKMVLSQYIVNNLPSTLNLNL